MMRILRWIPLAAAMGSIFLLSHQPGDTFDLPDGRYVDKFLHAAIYGALAASAMLAVPRTGPLPRYVLLVVGFCLLYGISDEIHQAFIPGRHSSLQDLAADTLGALVAVLCLDRFFRRRRPSPVSCRK